MRKNPCKFTVSNFYYPFPMTENPLLRRGFRALGVCKAKSFKWKGHQKSLKFAPCRK